MASHQPCLLNAALKLLTPVHLKAALHRKLGVTVTTHQTGALARQILRAACRSRTAHAHAWETVVATSLTRATLLGVAGKHNECRPQPVGAHSRNCCSKLPVPQKRPCNI